MRCFRYLVAGVMICFLGVLSAADSGDESTPAPVRQWTYNGRTYVVPNPQAMETDEIADEPEYEMPLAEAPVPAPAVNAEPAKEPESSSWFGTIVLAVFVVSAATMAAMLVFSRAVKPEPRPVITAFATTEAQRPSVSSTSPGTSARRSRKVREYTSTSITVRPPAPEQQYETEETVRISATQFTQEEPAVITSRIAAKHREAQRRSTSA